MKSIAKQIAQVWMLIFFVFLNACNSGAQESNLKHTISVQSTEIAHLSTQIADHVQHDQYQWDAVSYLSTQLPHALELITPIPPQVTISPTASMRGSQTPDPTSTPTPIPENFEYPPMTRTGIEEIDRVIDAILEADVQKRIDLVNFTTTACTTADGLGGPPKCNPDEIEGTLVKAFPVLASEGTHIRSDQIQDAMAFRVQGLLAVYRVPDDAYEAEYWPAGEYGIAFSSEEYGYPHMIILMVEAGRIVRLDDVMGWPPFDLIWDRSDAFVLPPLR